ncbi:MAG TPA: hypothetical protein ENJ10_12370 [Caldithrix abyssi]|uniref:Peptidase M1 membrane alanine aminopeptidase domain-containing protein n=1 Tax=Caldithrix abyssi TaxID=187145 RepID=A0A7V1PWC9_CALAY|nr:hypothetical protein [Caldithrix abyssi]
MLARSLLYLILFSTVLFGRDDYFQQNVNYKIDVVLDVENQTYKGKEHVVYVNNSPDTLTYIWMHLYPNAYKNETTAFARQEEHFSKSTFHFSPQRARGYLTLKKITSGDKALKPQFKKNNIDEIKIFLNKPLLPGDTVAIDMDFEGKFPEVFSRMGHTRGKYYAATQWYPKVVVYDRNGWHPDSYLDMGEFYGEFGDFDVSITLPDNYIIDATGMLQDNPEEEAFIDSVVSDTEALLKIKDEDEREAYWKKWQKEHRAKTDNTRLKKVRFIAHNVHDFAWFAGEDYMIHRKRQKNNVLTNVLVLPKNAWDWKDVPDYVGKTLDFYGKRVGPYQYPKASVVDGSLEAGGGMEYPMITIISTKYQSWSRFLEVVVMHEVGHNWFYGMLGSDERASTFMDEGNNAFTEWKYMEHYYGRNNVTVFDSLFGKWNTLSDAGEFDINYLMYGSLVNVNRDLPLNLRAEKYTQAAYGGINYAKSAFMLRALEWTITEPVFIKAMHTYFKRWNGRHPSVDDFWEVMTEVSGMDLSLFRKEWMTTTHYNDFKLERYETEKTEMGYKTTVYVDNKGDMRPLPAPVSLVTQDGDTLEQRWDGNPGHPVVFNHKSPLQKVVVNMDHIIFETSYLNNGSSLPVEFNFLDPIPSFTTYRGTWLPYADYEYFKDKTRLGFTGWIGNPITLQHFVTAKAYYATASGVLGYHVGYANRFRGFISSYADFSTEVNDKDGLRNWNTKLKLAFVDPYDGYIARDVTVQANYVNLYDAVYNEPGIYQRAEYGTVRLGAGMTVRRMLHRFKGRLSVEQALPLTDDKVEYTKLELSATYLYKVRRWLAVSADVYAGMIDGNTIPLQENIFAGGDVNPKHLKYAPGFRGDIGPLRSYTYLSGMNMPGYSGARGAYLNAKNGFSTGFTVHIPYGLGVYVRTGVLGNDLSAIMDQEFMTEYGLRLGTGNVKIILPLYVTNPPDGSDKFAFRYYFNLSMNLNLGRG